jgi:hypothetical protein
VVAGQLCFSLVNQEKAKQICSSIPSNPLLILNLEYSGDLARSAISTTTIQSNISQGNNLQAGFCRSPYAATNLNSLGNSNYSSNIDGEGVEVYVISGNQNTVRTGVEQFNWWPIIIFVMAISAFASYTWLAYKMRVRK